MPSLTRVVDAVVVSGKRTPIGSFLGALSRTSATSLATCAAQAALVDAEVNADEIGAVYFGNVVPSSKDAAYLARHVGLNVGAPTSAAALVVNRACASGMEAIVQGAKALAFQEAAFVLAGGAENMSQIPYAMRGVREGWRMIKSDVDDMLFSALHDDKAGCSIGETVEHLAEACGVTRADADAAAYRGQQRAKEAAANGIFAEEIAPVDVGRRGKERWIESDEAPRPETTLEGLAPLPGLYAKEGVVTAGNSCGLNDAAAAVVMTTGAVAAERGLNTLGRLVSYGVVGIEPMQMGLGPVAAIKEALQSAGLTLDDMGVIELNDSFSVQAVAVERALGLEEGRTNPNGGAIALGHPMGATGTRVVLTTLLELRRSKQRYGLAAVCVGGGQGMAVVVENPAAA